MPDLIDLRSDTVTRPTAGMRDAMFAAPLGDDVFGEDPTVNALEARVAKLLGKEAAIYVPSGWMANQIAIRLHCRPGDELLCEDTAHVVLWEGGGAATLHGVTCHTFAATNGIYGVEHVSGRVRPDDIHATQTRLLWVENTHNRGGGTIFPYEQVQAVTRWAGDHKLARHLDGARLWNAAVATGIPAATWASHFDTVSVCFSKGLGAPVGSALAGPRDLIKTARRYRKLLGGAMRQVGLLAAACDYALSHHIDRLADDHANAQRLADAVRHTPGLRLTPDRVDTNIVWIDTSNIGPASAVAGRLKEKGVLVAALGATLVRAVTHLDVSRDQCERAAATIRGLAG